MVNAVSLLLSFSNLRLYVKVQSMVSEVPIFDRGSIFVFFKVSFSGFQNFWFSVLVCVSY